MATHRMDVSVRFGVPDALEAAVDAAELPLVHVPDVRMHSEATAIAEIAAAGLVPGQRDPRPRPVNGRPEVVIRTHPRGGTLVRRGTRIDYEVAPGQPRAPMVTIAAYSDHDAASTLNSASAPPTLPQPTTTTRVTSEGYVDYDTADTVHVVFSEEAEVVER
jgi:beta-lactam-binding protein with PASTA domain